MDETTWNKILSNIKPISPSIEALLRSSQSKNLDGNKLKLAVYYKFHKDKLEEIKNKKLIEDSILGILSKQITIEVGLIDVPIKSELTESANQNIMTAAEEIFS